MRSHGFRSTVDFSEPAKVLRAGASPGNWILISMISSLRQLVTGSKLPIPPHERHSEPADLLTNVAVF